MKLQNLNREQLSTDAQISPERRTARASHRSSSTTPPTTGEIDATVAASADAPAIEIKSPATDATVHVNQYEVQIDVNDENIDDLMVAVYTSASGAKPAFSRVLMVKRSDRGQKSVVIALAKGVNRMEISDLKRDNVKAERTIIYAPASSVLGGTNASANPDAAGDGKVKNLASGSSSGTDSSTEGSTADSSAAWTLDDECVRRYATQEERAAIKAASDPKTKRMNLNAARLSLYKNHNVEDGLLDPALPFKCPNRGLAGVLLGGAYISQQGSNFSQADPSFGFIAGYNSAARKIFSRGAQVHYRVQGIFQVQPQTATAPAQTATASSTPGASATPTPTPTPSTPGTPTLFDSTSIPFLASRKTFDIEAHVWMDYPVGPPILRVGPYFGIGASTFLQKNELANDESVTTNSGGAAPAGTKLDTTQAQATNDLKRYIEGGVIGNFFLPDKPGELFMQTQFLYGNYEALQGLVPGHNTKQRFIGRLRVFPQGLDVNPNSHKIGFSPMFGVDLNAGRGPDQLKFFTGVAISINRFKAPAEPDNKQPEMNKPKADDQTGNKGADTPGSP